MWLNNKNRKVETARDSKKGKETEGCTFEPKLYKYKPPKWGKQNKSLNIIN